MRNDSVLEGAGGAVALSFGRAFAAPAPTPLADRLQERLGGIDLVPDLGADIGSRTWWRGAATCAALIAATWMLSPGFDRPTYGVAAPTLAGADWDEARAQSIAPLALGANSGHRLAPTAAVVPLTDTPERPTLELAATLTDGNRIADVLARAGVGSHDAGAVADLVAQKIALDELNPGTQLELVLGRRPAKDAPRPLEKLSFRARFDLSMDIARQAGVLALNAIPIAIDHTPLRIQGRVGPSLYRSARAAGVPAKAVEAFLRSVASRTPVSRIGSDQQFDVIVERARAATGEVQLGKLLYAGLSGDGSKLQLVRFEQGGKDSWFDAKGIGERTAGAAMMPVAGRLTSGFGMRTHPVLGYARMHKGLDIAAPSGAPIVAPMDGTVTMAGWAGGYGRFVKLAHANSLATGFGHMSRIAVSNGQRVSKGQVIGYVGSTGLSTGPHVHYELWKAGTPINPGKVTFESVQRLSGGALDAFKSRFAKLMAVPAAD
ncbi:M23 family metallopeptidase [Sphingomonas donggukensis]|uniref:M23 family metallopeptidase n=1 Tax=Sphingomonas donggukensis TaxID=2949093 RepID=A0ABY4TT95_9SPHN|nr:M23 family metallopeptidase [Sphingomonas donggukensis]URW75630.1 M23 family metallopeptidase [Sphingomonas donggukensis]